MLFVDISRAFDSVNREKLKAMIYRDLGQNPITRLISESYTDQWTEIFFNGEAIGKIPIRSGVKQGDPLSPLLFNLYINPALEATYEEPELRTTTNIMA